MTVKEDIQRIEEQVTQRELAMQPRFLKMDGDYDLWRLKKFNFLRGEGIADRDAFTLNTPKVFANKLVAGIGSATRVIRVENDSANEPERDVNNNFERLAIGFLQNATDLREDAGKPVDIQSELAWFGVVRGLYVSARALLTKDRNGDTEVRIDPIDPRNLVMQFGPDGPLWAAIVTFRERRAIRAEYPKFKFDGEDSASKREDGNQQERVIDYYWKGTEKKETGKFMNSVMVDTQYAKKPSDTFSVKFPVVMRLVGANPGVSSHLLGSMTGASGQSNQVPGIVDLGESAFDGIRDIVAFINRLHSYHMALTRKAVKGIYLVESAEGTKDMEEDIDEETTSIPLMKGVEDIRLLEVQQTTRDAVQLLQGLTIFMSDATLPEQSYGRLPAAVSGRALSLLGSTIGERLTPFLKAVQSCLKGVILNLDAQYATGRYRTLKVAGKTFDRQPFNRDIEPADVEGHGILSVDLRPLLPQDDAANMQLAMLATRPDPLTGNRLMSFSTARDDILKMQDSNLESQRVSHEEARSATPMMKLLTVLEAAAKEEDAGAVAFYQEEIQRLLRQRELEDIQMQMLFAQLGATEPLRAASEGVGGGGAGNGTGTPPNPAGGLAPETNPLSGTPLGGPTVVSQDAGANRPGATEDGNLSDAGLERTT